MNIRRIISFLVVLLAAVNIECQAYVKYVTTGLSLRYGPGTEYSVITVIPRGTAVTIDEDCDCKWVPVEYNGLIGYISTKYLSSNPQYIQTYTNQKNKYHQSSHTSGSIRYYTNTYGNRIQSPTYYSSAPAGATALCRDGTYSFSQSRRGTCSHHGGVARWL